MDYQWCATNFTYVKSIKRNVSVEHNIWLPDLQFSTGDRSAETRSSAMTRIFSQNFPSY